MSSYDLFITVDNATFLFFLVLDSSINYFISHLILSLIRCDYCEYFHYIFVRWICFISWLLSPEPFFLYSFWSINVSFNFSFVAPQSSLSSLIQSHKFQLRMLQQVILFYILFVFSLSDYLFVFMYIFILCSASCTNKY